MHGVTFDKTLDDTYNLYSSVSDTFKRIHLIQRKDINNIEVILKLQGGQRHPDDATSTSVAARVGEMKKKGEDNVVSTLTFKVPVMTKQGCKTFSSSLSRRPQSKLKC